MLGKLTGALTRVAFTAALLGAAAVANAGIITATASLDFGQEVDPSNPEPSDATGTAIATFDTDTGLLSVVASIQGISLTDITFASGGLAFGALGPFHIHNGPVGVNAPIVIPFNQESFFSDDGMGGLSINIADVPFSNENLDDLTADSLYLNLHTLDYGSGEIRGQLSAVPEPASIALLGGMLGMVGMRRRKLSLQRG